MEELLNMDELELFMLDFLAYRRKIRERRNPSQTEYLPANLKLPHPTNPYNEEPPQPTEQLEYIFYDIHSIGKGWPHYKNIAKSIRSPYPHTPEPSMPTSDIIPTLTPFVNQALNQFGNPTTPKAMEQLVCQVIASAMAIPLISQCIHTAEASPWGRVPLLQAVVELMICLAQDKHIAFLKS